MDTTNLVYEANEIICREGDTSSDLYMVQEGRIFICTVQGTHVKAIARINKGEFMGELSFFDGKPRASYVIALERCVMLKIPKDEIMNNLPFWFIEIGKNLTKKIRLLDDIVHESNFRKIGSEDQKPLTIEEQRQILAAITK